jgi:iron complex transport system substrate-binding protein
MTTRRPFLVLAGTLAVVVLASCGSTGDDGATSSATDAAAVATTAAPDTTAAPATTAAPTTAAPTTAAPTTAAPATTPAAAEGAIVPGADPEVDAVVAAYSAVFDSAVPFEQKQAFLPDAGALRPTLDKYATTGAAFGGIKLQPTAVTIDGDTASVTYDVMFGGKPAYEALSGTAVRQNGAWVVTREEFCGFMSSARTPCEG